MGTTMRTRSLSNKANKQKIMKARGVTYSKEGKEGERGVDVDGNAWFHDVQSVCGGYKTTIKLLRTCDVRENEGMECGIALDKFDEVRLDCTGNSVFFPAKKEYSIALMECGHIFAALSIVNHMAMSNMRCAFCRNGYEKKMSTRYIPKVKKSHCTCMQSFIPCASNVYQPIAHLICIWIPSLQYFVFVLDKRQLSI